MKTIFQVFPKTKRCSKWIEENVQSESWQWLGRSLCVEHGFIQNLYEGMVEAGLRLNKDFVIN